MFEDDTARLTAQVRLVAEVAPLVQESLELALKVGGTDNVLYGSDYPHNIGDMKGCLARVDALPAAQRDAVRGGNAMRIFKL